ncbi:MAG: ParB/RepB/Spo0J family partition protein [Desulfobulbaceae bacterium]|jgi:ParB-like chromosome segregation protein Spo0J|nr:ParB/RepB/Spo0J family partition protein [Desulfobulbaceae bacterium]
MKSPFFSWHLCRLTLIERESPWSLHPFIDQEPLSGDLIASVREHGVLQPPLVMASKGDTFVVLSGLRRLRALRQVGGEETLCRVVAADIGKRALLLLIFEEHRWHSPLTVSEKAFFLALARRFLPPEGLSEFYRLLALAERSQEMAKLLTLINLPPEILRAAHEGRISATTVQALAALSTEDQRSVFATLTAIPLGDNKQKRFLALLAEASDLCEETSAAILQLNEITTIFADKQINQPQKAQRLLDALAALSAPESSAAERRFRQWRSALALPAGARVEHSPAFENDALRLILPFAGRQALEAFWHGRARRPGS